MSFGNCRNYCVTDEAWRDETPDTIKAVSELKSPRVIKTHFSYEMLPTEVREKKCKVSWSRTPIFPAFLSFTLIPF